MYFVISIKTHSSVSAAKKTKKVVRHTSVLFTGTAKLPNSAFCISKTTQEFLPNLYIFCLTYTLLHISNLKEIASAVLEIFVPKNCPIFFTFFFFLLLLRTKLQIHLSPIKITFPYIDCSQIWNTYKAH